LLAIGGVEGSIGGGDGIAYVVTLKYSPKVDIFASIFWICGGGENCGQREYNFIFVVLCDCRSAAVYFPPRLE